jgi:GNAT superfamily N-acetyltransferase
MHAESSYSRLEFSEDRLREIFNQYTKKEDRILLVGLVNGEMCGLYAGYLAPYYFSRELVANDIAWFVVKERRGSRLGLRLLGAFEQWAKDNGASEVRVGYSTDINPSAFDSLMLKRGYSRVGGNYRLENSPC